MAADFDDHEHLERLPRRRRVTETNEGSHESEATVHCPLRRLAVRVSQCEACPRFVKQLDASVECRLPPEVSVQPPLAGQMLGTELTCLDAELEAARAVELLALAGVTSAPVLDDNAVLIGVVSSGALARLRGAEHFSDPLEVEDAMSTEVVTLSERATIGEVARVMAERGLDRLPIVTEDGHLVGVLSAMDVVRWLADWAP